MHWCIENGFSNAEDKKAFVYDHLIKSNFTLRAVSQGDLETMRLLVKAGLDLRNNNYLPIAQTNGHTEMVTFLTSCREANGEK